MWEVKVAYDLGILKHCGPITSYKKRLIKFRSSLHISFSLLKCFNTHQIMLYRRTPKAFCNVYHSPTLLKIGSTSISLSSGELQSHHLLGCHARGINSLCFSNLLHQAKKSDMNNWFLWYAFYIYQWSSSTEFSNKRVALDFLMSWIIQWKSTLSKTRAQYCQNHDNHYKQNFEI